MSKEQNTQKLLRKQPKLKNRKEWGKKEKDKDIYFVRERQTRERAVTQREPMSWPYVGMKLFLHHDSPLKDFIMELRTQKCYLVHD